MREILFLEPVFTHNIWGGTKLHDLYGYDISGSDIGECWGIAAHENGDAGVKGKDTTLSRFFREHKDWFGDIPDEKFPLLVKIIDAKDDLSIQVHPDDAYAAEHENGSLGKTECWYILDAPEGASLVAGHHAKTREELVRMIEENRFRDLIREIPVKTGDFIQIDPGTVHAIKGGLVILETQQNSDITYRLYDYDRLQNGKKRPLHIRQSIDVITVPAKDLSDQVIRAEDTAKAMQKNEPYTLYSSDKYSVFLFDTDGECRFMQTHPFMNMTVTEGKGCVNGEKIKKGDHFIIPCDFGEVWLTGKMKLVGSCI